MQPPSLPPPKRPKVTILGARGGEGQQLSKALSCVASHVIFLVDISGSMCLPLEGRVGRRIDAVFTAIEKFLVLLASAAGMTWSLATFNDSFDLHAVNENIANWKPMLDKIRMATNPSGGGRYLEALNALRLLCSKAEPGVTVMDVAVLLSDGTPTEDMIDRNMDPVTEALEGVKRDLGQQCQLHTFGFGAFENQWLKRIAEVGGGQFFENRTMDPELLKRTFVRLSAQVSTMRRTVMACGPDALKRLPQKTLESENAWRGCTDHQREAMSEKHWVWVVLEKKDAPGELETKGDARRVFLHRKPFAEGGLRYAFHLFMPPPDPKKDGLHLVVKESKFQLKHDSPEQVNSFFLKNHRRAEELSKQFTERCKSLAGDYSDVKPSFCPAYVIKMDDAYHASGFRYVTAERYIDGKYQKFNDNCGNVESEDVSRRVAEVAAAFSHFSFVHAESQEICVDIQGVGLNWTDPQLHSLQQEYGPADLGREGMQLFFNSHRCNKLCQGLGLQTVDSATLKIGDALHERTCLICLDAPRAVVCKPCNHLCFCSSCAAQVLKAKSECPLCRKAVTSTATLADWAVPTSTLVPNGSAGVRMPAPRDSVYMRYG